MEDNVLFAFILTLAAGAATGLGALLPFALPNSDNNATLGICLGLSAGVMIYISFTEIYTESVEMFAKIPSTKHLPILFSSIAFFSGALLCILLDWLVHFILPDEEQTQIKEKKTKRKSKRKSKPSSKSKDDVSKTDDNDSNAPTNQQLTKMSALSALAIALHNLPEGMATFFASLTNPKLGASLAVAIAIHNIPEGIAVALPIYYATNSKSKAFLYGFASGLTEPLGGIIAYYIIKLASASSTDVTESAAFSFMFALVSGMMVYISLVEL
eukprot:NODE_24_length_41419_cov_0.818780.p20 type:complete len:271 gc:universal NODE_24_length_41419_cov_0.818780:28632-29444(+)